MAVNLFTCSCKLRWLFNKHGYLLFSVVFHLLLFYILSHLAVKTPVTQSLVDQRVKLSMNNAYKIKMQQSVRSIAQAQNELLNSLDESLKKNLQLAPVDTQVIDDPKVTLSKLMELANKISENIRKIQRELRAQDLQRAVTMPRSDVMKRVMSMEIDLPQYRGNRIKGSTMMKLAEAMEKEAEDALSHRRKDISIRGFGNSTSDIKKIKTPPLAYYSEGDPNLIKGVDSSIASTTAQQGFHRKNDFADLWLDHIPRVNRENPKKVAGRIIKASGRPADRLFINSWYIIGPFADSATKHPPEYAVDLEGVYYGKENHPVSWKYLSNSQYPLIPPQVDKAGVFFGYTEIIVEREQDLWVWIGADDFTSLELNNQLIWDSDVFNKKFNALAYEKNSPERDNWNLTEFKRRVHFNAGRNTFKFKLTNADTVAFFSLVLTK